MKLNVKAIISTVISIILTGLLPSLVAGLVPIPFTVLAILICVFLSIIFSLIQSQIVSKSTTSFEEEINDLKSKKEAMEKEISDLRSKNEATEETIRKLEEEVASKNNELQEYKHNSYAATGIVFNSNYTKVLLAYHERQKRWIPPGSHIKGIQYFHEVVLDSAKQETGYTMRFHESHDYEKYRDANCCIVPCPFSVQVETQVEGEGHKIHYDALYILIADEQEEILKPGSNQIKWLEVSKLEAFARGNNTYPDVVQSVNEALKIIQSHTGGTQNGNK